MMRGRDDHRDADASSTASEPRLTPLGGEFADPALERRFRFDRFADLRRNARLLFALSTVLNTAFLLSDWRFAGTDHFYVAVTARLVVVAVSLLCLALAQAAVTVRAIYTISILWQWVTAAGVAVLVSSRSDLALFVVLLLPTVFYLTVPLPFAWTVIGGVGASVLLLAGYIDPAAGWRLATGLALALAVLNWALLLMVLRANRLDRRQWAAIQAERRANERLTESENVLEKTFQAVPVPLVVTTLKDGRVLRYNDVAARFYGAPASEHVGTSILRVYDDPSVRARLVRQLEEEGSLSGFETRIRLEDGSVRDVLLAARLTEMEGAPCIVAAVIDLSERLAAEQKARHAASHDALTGLPNRAAFQEHLERAFKERRLEQGVCLLMVDLDGLKDVNDTLGHDAGDVLIMETAHRLSLVVGERATLARFGGDEFVVLLRAREALAAGQRLAQAIISDLRRPVQHEGRQLSTRASIGIAACPEHDCAPAELMKDADLALYTAKQQGRNRCVVYAPAMRHAVSERVALSRDIGAALAHDQIVPYYQPKICLGTGRLIGFEALVRWQRDAQTVLAPAAFSLAMEDAELAFMIGERMARRVAADVRGWLEAGHGIGRVALNVSPAQFTHRELGTALLRHFHAAGVEAHHFDVEITETVFLGRNSDFVAPILDELYRAGVRIALDDFGTGYAGFTHLKQLPIDTIKIDQSFVKDIEQDAFDTAIVCAVIELGRNLGMRVVAEGVETVGQARFLKARGCEFAQGYLFARPMPATGVSAFLRAECSETAAARLALIA
ncbi:putative bifunctional diguanylate cyclase/phosphodiesterase [Xanthobacter pseudotagetidis]|uniref:putative bifunctional diguanylate cyclase/phosphodiesterase n=1 Tax=Xanthobacter pseudotagetidis TaxID=3119911 RepID=UPI00372898AC